LGGYEFAWVDYIFFLGPPILTGIGIFLGVFLGVSLSMRRWSPGKSRDLGKTPLEIVGSRYALGEIQRSEYEQMRDDLGAEPTFEPTKSRTNS